MKIYIVTISILFLFSWHLKAENEELTKLKEENETAVKKVLDKYEENLKRIDQLYYKKLQELQQKCMQEGDLDGAIAVREELRIFKDKLGIIEKNDKPKPKNNTSNHNSKPPKKTPPPEEEKTNESTDDKKGEEEFGEEEF